MEGFLVGYTSPISDTFWLISTVALTQLSSMMGDGSFSFMKVLQNAEAIVKPEFHNNLLEDEQRSALWF